MTFFLSRGLSPPPPDFLIKTNSQYAETINHFIPGEGSSVDRGKTLFLILLLPLDFGVLQIPFQGGTLTKMAGT